ncbi:MAG TPA: type IV pilus twitching motility protein PilT [Candidatus Hydrogenedentes bacterium]|nr:type IV pilus twitching motility protein PilT [Candidatus Hydrogenedentota bacterium]HNT87371.1 type IV pilus twitching motility protein PilT [Candidatus Hydrogenedentota bacterium]
MITLKKILAYAVQNGASDAHLTVGSPPAVRIDGEIRFIDTESLTPQDTLQYLDEIMDDRQKDQFLRTGDADLALGLSGLGRFRVNVLRQRGSVGIVMRHVRGKILDFESLHLPPVMEKIANLPRGLVLITGTTGSGKSTTLASLIDWINQRKRLHIVTLEDPIEFLHTNKKSIITQREISIDTKDFHVALRAAMREDPDVILVGEMRDAETFQAAISAAETGHLVFSTLHTTNAMMTMDRILDMFPSNQQPQISSQLSLQLRASIAQRLLQAASGKGRIPAVEVMINNPGIAALIREGNMRQIPVALASGAADGMQTFNMSLAGLIKQKLITKEEAMWNSDNPDELEMTLQGVHLSKDRGGILKR